MVKCHFCKKEYKGYPIIMSSDIECFAMEEHIKDIYYDDETGICESCREKHIYKDPVSQIRAWLSVRAQMVMAKQSAEERKDKKYIKVYEDALKRIKKHEDKLEQTKEVKELYMKNNPAMFKEKPKKSTLCIYCGENNGQEWINDPNEKEPKIENCWWVCLPCKRMIEKQQEFSFLSHVEDFFEEKGIKSPQKAKEKIEQLKEEIQDIAYEDGQEVACIEIKKDKKGFSAKRVY